MANVCWKKCFHKTFAEFLAFNVCQAQKTFKLFVGNMEKFTNVQTFKHLEMFVGGENRYLPTFANVSTFVNVCALILAPKCDP